MISIIDFVKAFNTDLKYSITVFNRERAGMFHGSKGEFLEKAKTLSWIDKYYLKEADFNFSWEWDEDDNKLVVIKDEHILFIDTDTPRHKWNLKEQDLNEHIKFDDFTVNDLKDFEKELGYVKNFKVNNVIAENNIVKSFDVEKC